VEDGEQSHVVPELPAGSAICAAEERGIMMKELGIGGQAIRQSEKTWCARCNQPIVDANRSGWEVFIKDDNGEILTQPICVFCNETDLAAGKKEQEEQCQP